jgi:hypothetical protein
MHHDLKTQFEKIDHRLGAIVQVREIPQTMERKFASSKRCYA